MSDVSVSAQALSRFSSSNSEHSLKRAVSNFEDELPQYLKPKRKVKNIITPEVTATLDRIKLSSRKAAFFVNTIAKVLNVDVRDFNSSASSIQRNRNRSRASIVSKMNLKTSNYLVLHWDGKLLPDDNESKKVERLPIVVSGENTEQLLGAPKLQSGTAINQVTAIVDVLNDWELTNRVEAICFDRTSVNTGECLFLT